MGFCKSVDRIQLFNLLTSMLGIYILYFIAGILHESLIKRPHYNRFTKNYEICENTAGLIFFPFLIAWLMGFIYNRFFISQRVIIPHKNSALAAAAVVAATFFSILAIQRTSFPVVIMFQSCSILPVVFIGVFCSRVHDPNLKLGPKKIAVALIIAAGILVFQFADPQTKQRQTKQQFIGIIFLLFHFVAEGFLPDLQAQIKVNYKPRPTQMMADINKWGTIFTLVIAVATMSAWPFLVFLWQHTEFTIDLVIMCVTSGFGQFFVYRMIKQFKQHFVPFTISSRKILTVAISIAFYGHQTNWIQIAGICIVLFTVFVQFMTQISAKQQKTATQQINMQLNEEKIDERIVNSSQQKGQNQSASIEQNQNNIEEINDCNQSSKYNNKIVIQKQQQSKEKEKAQTQQTQKNSQLNTEFDRNFQQIQNIEQPKNKNDEEMQEGN